MELTCCGEELVRLLHHVRTHYGVEEIGLLLDLGYGENFCNRDVLVVVVKQ